MAVYLSGFIISLVMVIWLKIVDFDDDIGTIFLGVMVTTVLAMASWFMVIIICVSYLIFTSKKILKRIKNDRSK